MKKQIILLAGGVALGFASCNQQAAAPSQAMIDSLVNAKLEVYKLELEKSNDSVIQARATQMYDEMVAAKASGATVPTRTTRPTTTKTTTPPPPVKSTQDSKFDQRDGGNKTITPEKAKEQDDKFNRRGG